MIKINQDDADGFTLDVSIWSHYKNEKYYLKDTIPMPQARYLVHGIDDSMWTDSIEDVISYLREELERLETIAPTEEKE